MLLYTLGIWDVARDTLPDNDGVLALAEGLQRGQIADVVAMPSGRNEIQQQYQVRTFPFFPQKNESCRRGSRGGTHK